MVGIGILILCLLEGKSPLIDDVNGNQGDSCAILFSNKKDAVISMSNGNRAVLSITRPPLSEERVLIKDPSNYETTLDR